MRCKMEFSEMQRLLLLEALELMGDAVIREDASTRDYIWSEEDVDALYDKVVASIPEERNSDGTTSYQGE